VASQARLAHQRQHHINQLDRKGKSLVYRKGAGTNGLYRRAGRLLACEPVQRRVTRTEPTARSPCSPNATRANVNNQPNDITSIEGPHFSPIHIWQPRRHGDPQRQGPDVEGVTASIPISR